MADLYLTPAERYTAALGGFYYGDLPEPGTVYTQLIKDILEGSTPDKEPKNILARFIYSLYISDLGDPYPRYELAKLLYWKLHDITPTKSGSILTVTIDGKEDYMTINTDLSRLWYKVLFGSKTDVITEFPYIFNTMQTKLSDWELFGNAEVSGTPAPDSPIMLQGTGERTENLFSCKIEQGTISAEGGLRSADNRARSDDFIIMEAGEYTINALSESGVLTLFLFEYMEDGTFVSRTPIDWTNVPYTFSLTGKRKIKFVFAYSSGNITPVMVNSIMLNTGSTALPYEPYGYKIPILSAGQTTPVYLGEVETTRKIKKLVLTGEENVTMPATSSFQILGVIQWGDINGFCTHYPQITWNEVSYATKNGFAMRASSDGADRFRICDLSITTVADFKAYLAQQYAAGTPVTVWYVLANEETGIVNEPLMRIGDYADSMSRTQTGVDIPTVVGQNTLDVLTTVKPSSMRIEYTSADETKSRSKRISLLKSPLKKGLIK